MPMPHILLNIMVSGIFFMLTAYMVVLLILFQLHHHQMLDGPYTYHRISSATGTIWILGSLSCMHEPYVFQRNDGKWIFIYMGDTGRSCMSRLDMLKQMIFLDLILNLVGNPCIPFGSPGSL